MTREDAKKLLTSAVDALGFIVTLRVLAGVATDYAGRMEDADYQRRACEDIRRIVETAANAIGGEKA